MWGGTPTDTAFLFWSFFLWPSASKKKAAKWNGLARENSGRFVTRPYGDRNTHIVGERFFSANRSPTKHIAQSTEALVVQNNQIGG